MNQDEITDGLTCPDCGAEFIGYAAFERHLILRCPQPTESQPTAIERDIESCLACGGTGLMTDVQRFHKEAEIPFKLVSEGRRIERAGNKEDAEKLYAQAKAFWQEGNHGWRVKGIYQ